jgi:hypothetical protein
MSDGTFDYVGDGGSLSTDWQPIGPTEQQEAEQSQKAVQASSYPIMDEVAKWFDNAIHDASGLDNIKIDELTINGVKYSRTVSVEAQVLAYQLLEQLLTQKRAEWAEFGKDDD